MIREEEGSNYLCVLNCFGHVFSVYKYSFLGSEVLLRESLINQHEVQKNVKPI